jgi:hypothetical protein
MGDIIRATSSFTFTNSSGTPVSIREGETFHGESRRLDGLSDEARAGSFEPFVPDHDIEQATAAPGEKRRTRRKPDKKDDQATAAPGEKSSESGADAASADAKTAGSAK